MLLRDAPKLAGDHLTRHGVDRSRARRLVEPGARHAAHAPPALDGDAALLAQRDARHDEGAVGGVGVLPGVLAHAALRPGAPLGVLPTPRVFHLDAHLDAGGHLHAHVARETLAEKRPPAGLGRRGRAGSRGVAAAQALAPHLYVVLEAHAPAPSLARSLRLGCMTAGRRQSACADTLSS